MNDILTCAHIAALSRSAKAWRPLSALAAFVAALILVGGARPAGAVFTLTLTETLAEGFSPLTAADQLQLDQVPVGTYITGLHYNANGTSTGGVNAEGDQIVVALVNNKKTITSFTSDTPSDRSPKETDMVTFGGTAPFFLDASTIVVNSPAESANPILEPEPRSLSLMAVGVLTLVIIGRRRRATRGR